MSEHNISFPGNGSEAHGYLELPASGSGPALIVIQEWWGLTTHIASLVRRFAAEGFVALGPDLYGGRTTHDADEAGRLKDELPPEQAARDLAGAVDFLLGHDAVTSSTVGVTGFCMGGGFALTLAAQQSAQVSTVAPFYGLPADDSDLTGVQAAVQGHYGLRDQGVSPERVRAFAARLKEESGNEPELHFYDAGHAFLNDERPEAYQSEAASQAWARAVEFLRTTIH